MALLGTLIDITRNITFLGAAWGGATLVTVANSLPTSQPDTAFAVPTSIQALSAVPGFAMQKGQPGTLEVVGPTLSGASQPTVQCDVVTVLFHSIIR